MPMPLLKSLVGPVPGVDDDDADGTGMLTGADVEAVCAECAAACTEAVMAACEQACPPESAEACAAACADACTAACNDVAASLAEGGVTEEECRAQLAEACATAVQAACAASCPPEVVDACTEACTTAVQAACGATGATGPDAEVPHEEGEETAADEAAESPETQAAEAAAGTELHSTTEFVEQVTACANELPDMLKQLQDAIDELDDPSAADAILASAEEAIDTADDIVKAAEAAKKDDDITAAAGAAAQIEEIKSMLTDAIAQVGQLATMTPEDATAPAVPAAAPTAPPAAAKGAKGGKGKGEPPLATWATKTMAGAKGCH